MDLSLTPEQEMLKTAVRGFIQQEYPKDTLLEIAAEEQPVTAEPWQRLVATGWLGIAIPQEYGGEGGSLTDAGVLFEELGRGPVPGPHLSSCVLAASAILEGGTVDQKRQWLPALARGERILVPAMNEGSYSWAEEDVQVVARQDGGGLRLDGTKVYVFDAVSATHLLCTARSEESNEVGLVIVPVTANGVAIRSLPGFTWNMYEVKLDGVSVDQSSLIGSSFAGGWDALQ